MCFRYRLSAADWDFHFKNKILSCHKCRDSCYSPVDYLIAVSCAAACKNSCFHSLSLIGCQSIRSKPFSGFVFMVLIVNLPLDLSSPAWTVRVSRWHGLSLWPLIVRLWMLKPFLVWWWVLIFGCVCVTGAGVPQLWRCFQHAGDSPHSVLWEQQSPVKENAPVLRCCNRRIQFIVLMIFVTSLLCSEKLLCCTVRWCQTSSSWPIVWCQQHEAQPTSTNWFSLF